MEPSTPKAKGGKASEQLVLEESTLRVPLERLRMSLRLAQKDVDSTQRKIGPIITKIGSLAVFARSNPEFRSQIQTEVTTLLTQLRDLKARLEALERECRVRYDELAARQANLAALYTFSSVADPAFELWSVTRLDRYIGDYLLQMGRTETAKMLLQKKGLTLACDADVWSDIVAIERKIRDRDLQPGLKWCDRHRYQLKKLSIPLEFHFRVQLFLEFLRLGTAQARSKAIGYAQKYLGHDPNASKVVPLLSGLMVAWTGRPRSHPFLTNPSPSLVDGGESKYVTFVDTDRFDYLADYFVHSARLVYGINPDPPLVAALSLGLSILKTPMCRKRDGVATAKDPVRMATAAAANSGASTVCPVCSPELADLAKEMPYGHHTNSHVDSDLVVLPNGNIYSRASLDRANSVLGLADSTTVFDPSTPTDMFKRSELEKVYIS